MSDLVLASASQLAQMIRDRQVSAVEVWEAHLQQIEMHNAKLNAIVTFDQARARKQAEAADEALGGN